VLALIIPVTAQDFSAQQKALDMIADFAEKICKSAPIEGQSSDVQLTGGAKAELSGLLKKVADLHLEGAAKYNSGQYTGVLQKDLATTIKDAQDCKLAIWKDLQDKLVFAAKPQPAEPLVPALPASPTLAGTWEDEEGRVFAAVADPKHSGVFELEQIQPRKESDTLWKATLTGRQVEIDVFAMPSGSHQVHMDLELSLDGNRLVGLARSGGAGPADEPPVSIHFRRKH
jgi:hypothetical protein